MLDVAAGVCRGEVWICLGEEGEDVRARLGFAGLWPWGAACLDRGSDRVAVLDDKKVATYGRRGRCGCRSCPSWYL